MTADDFEAHLRGLGLRVDTVTGDDQARYTVVRSLVVPAGALQGRTCDLAIRREEAIPFIVPSGIHTNPALVPMSGPPLATSPSPIGPGWQYWSRRYDRAPTPKALWAHILTILCDDRWPTS
jgi:hypothetical protein